MLEAHEQHAILVLDGRGVSFDDLSDAAFLAMCAAMCMDNMPSVLILLNSLCNNVQGLLQKRAGNAVGGSGAKIAQQLHGPAIGNPENQHL